MIKLDNRQTNAVHPYLNMHDKGSFQSSHLKHDCRFSENQLEPV